MQLPTLILLTALVALAIDVKATPPRRTVRHRSRAATRTLRATVTALVILLAVGYINALGEESQETGRSLAYVLVAGNDTVDWSAAPRWYPITLGALLLTTLTLWHRHRLQDWAKALPHKPRSAILLRLAAALVALAAFTLAILAT